MSFLSYLKQKQILPAESTPTKTPGFFDFPTITAGVKAIPKVMDRVGNATINFVKDTVTDPFGSATRRVNKVGNAVINTKTFQKMLDDTAKAKTPGDRVDVLAKPAAGFALFLAKEIAAGTVSIGKSVQDVIDPNKKMYRGDPTKNSAMDKAIFGRDIKSIQDAYVKPVSQFADSKGSGALEKGILATGAGLGGFLVESPVGAPAKQPIKALVKDLVRERASREVIDRGILQYGLSEDAARELGDSAQAIIESGMKQGQKAVELQNLIDDVIKRSKAVPNGPSKSVVSVVNTKTGENTFYTVSPEDLKVLSEDVIDGTGRGVAGKRIGDNIFHLTAKTPTQMMESAGFKDGGQKTMDEIMDMLTTKKRVPIRTFDGKYAGSFIDETPAFSLRQTAEEKQLADQVAALSRKSINNEGAYDLSLGEANNTIRNLFTKEEMGFIIREDLIDGKAVGKFTPNSRALIEVVAKDGKVQSDTVYHEAFHGYFNTFKTAEERQLILERVKGSVATFSRELKDRAEYRTADARAEEWLADDFARYVREVSSGKKPTSLFADIWARVLRQIRQWIRKVNSFDTLYNDILEKRRTGYVEKRPNRTAKYKEAPKEEPTPKKDAPEKPYEMILLQLSGAEAGERIGRSNADGTFAGYSAKHSTFPSWLPESLRSRELFDKYMDGRTGDFNDFDIKYKKGSKLEQLDNAVRQKVYEETGNDMRLIPDDLDYIDELAQQYANEIDVTTGEPLQMGNNALDPVGSIEKQILQTGSQTGQSVLKGGSSPKVYPTEAKKAIVDIAQRRGETVKKTVQRFEGLRRMKTNILEYVQNTDERVRQLMERKDITVTDKSNIYQKATLAPGRMGTRIEQVREEAKTVLEDVRDTAKTLGSDYETIKGEVDDYLIARHAPERNEALGEKAAGITTAEAEALKAKLENGPHGKEVVRIADAIQKMNEKTLDILLNAQVISEDLYTLLRNTYKNHVPLYRIQESEGDIGGLLTGKGFDVRSTGIKRAKGSDKEIDDIIGNVVYNYEQAIIRSEKNTVDLATLQFVRENKESLKGLMKEVQLPFVPVAMVTHKGQVFSEVMNKVNELITKYGGTYERKLKTGRSFGFFRGGENKVVTRFGTSKDTLIHEFGHMLDQKFGLKEGDFFTSDISKELRTVADLRDSFDPNLASQRTKSRQAYVRSGQEKIAEFISMYFSDMDNARKVAPLSTAKFTKFLADKPELRELSDVMKSRVRSEEMMQEQMFAQQRFTNDPKILTLRENGKPVYIKVEDPNLAIAIRGVGREKLGGLLNGVRWFTNFYSGLHTRFNPDFALPNKIRDLQETITYLAAQKDVSFKDKAKFVGRDPKSVKDVVDFLRGKDTEGARMYKEMKEMGGTTGGMGLSTRQQVDIDMKKLDKLVNSKTRRSTEALIEYVDNWNTIFEDSTRLTVYRTALQSGLSKERAAFLAKEASINFNRMGKGGPVVNAIWMFSNASIQGSTKMLRALKDPKVLAGVTATVGVSVAATAEWNDSVDPEWREKVPKWDRLNSLPVVLPTMGQYEEDEKGFVQTSKDGTFRYFVIPVSWGLKPIKVMTDYAYDALSGYGKSAEDITVGILTSIIEGYNPVGGTDLNSALMPTILDTPYEIARNMKWSGSKITPTNYNNMPDDTLYYPDLGDTITGKASISLSELLVKGNIEVSPANIKYAYESYIGGAGRFINRMFNSVAGAFTGDPVPLDEYPFIARFYRERSQEELDYTKSTETDTLDNLKDDDARAKQKIKVRAEEVKDEIMALPTAEEKKARLKELNASEPEVAKKVLDMIEDEKAGLSPQESQLKNATVKVRAQYIRAELEKMKTPEEKKAYLKAMRDKKILTAAVLDELGL